MRISLDSAILCIVMMALVASLFYLAGSFTFATFYIDEWPSLWRGIIAYVTLSAWVLILVYSIDV